MFSLHFLRPKSFVFCPCSVRAVDLLQVFVRGLGTNILDFITRLCFASPQEFFQPSKRASPLLLSSSPFRLFVHRNLQLSVMRSAFVINKVLTPFSKTICCCDDAHRCSEHVLVSAWRSVVEAVVVMVLCRLLICSCSLLFLSEGNMENRLTFV